MPYKACFRKHFRWTPCIISDVNNILDFNDNLKKLMIVKKQDDVWIFI